MNSSLLTIGYRGLARLVSPSRKLRKNDPAVERMAASIEAYGFKIPILVSSEGENCRRRPAPESSAQAGLRRSARDRVRRLASEQVRGFRLLANGSANWVERDLTAIAEELAKLRSGGAHRVLLLITRCTPQATS